MRALLDAGADADLNERGATPLFIASTEGHDAIVLPLLDACADKTAKCVARRRVALQSAAIARLLSQIAGDYQRREYRHKPSAVDDGRQCPTVERESRPAALRRS